MSKKNSSVNLKDNFKRFKDISQTYFDFKNKLNNLKEKSFIVAVSGGPDSLALVALSNFYKSEEKKNFFYVLVDHNIRKNSSLEAIKVKKLLGKKKIKLTILLNKKKIKKNIQKNARDIRYKKLINFCIKKKAKVLLTAHNLEDQVETFFIRLSRGSGLRGLSSMKQITKMNNNVYLYRPLLDTKKKTLRKITKRVFGKYFKDPSNTNQKYLRTKIRSLEKHLIKSGINYDQIYKSIKNLASSEAILEKYFQKIFKDSVKKNRRSILINFKKFKDLDNEIKIRLINQSIKSLRENYYNPRSKKVINLINKLKSNKLAKSTLAGCIFQRKNNQIILKEEKT